MTRDGLVSCAIPEALTTEPLRASETQYQELGEDFTDIVLTLNSDGDFTSFNAAVEGAAGYSHREAGPYSEIEACRETVLLVDDEEMIRTVLHACLRKSGYSVLEAASGLEATQIAEHHGRRIDLLLTDVVMPQMSGPQSAERLLEIHPEMKVLYMSGHNRDMIVSYGIGESDSPLLKKPFTLDSLARTVRELLESSVSPPRNNLAGQSG